MADPKQTLDPIRLAILFAVVLVLDLLFVGGLLAIYPAALGTLWYYVIAVGVPALAMMLPVVLNLLGTRYGALPLILFIVAMIALIAVNLLLVPVVF
jgi:hypothetical protein